MDTHIDGRCARQRDGGDRRTRTSKRRAAEHRGRTHRLALLAVVLFSSLAMLVYLTTTTAQTVEIDEWTPTTPYPFAVASRNAVVHGDFIYVFGGRVGEDTSARVATNAVRMARIQDGGSLGDWDEATNLPAPLYNHAVAADENYVYVVGGWNTILDSITRQVWRAPFRDGGGIGRWQLLREFPGTDPQGINLHTAEVIGDRLYVFGGWDGNKAQDWVYSASIVPDGIGRWNQETQRLPQPAARLDSVQHNGYVYLVGGGYDVKDEPDKQFAEIYVARINPDNSLGSWTPTTPMRAPLYYHQAVVHDGNLVVLGGQNNAGISKLVWSSPIASNGQLGDWRPEPQLKQAIFRFAAVSVTRYGSDYIYTVGGWGVDNAYRSDVYHSAAPPPYTPTPTPGIDTVLHNAPDHWVAPNDLITYSFTLDANDVADFVDVTLTNRIPPQTELVTGSVTAGNGADVTVEGEQAGSIIRWQWDEFQRATSDVVSYQVRRLQPLGPDVPIALSIEKQGPARATANEPIVYTLTVVNNTPITLDDVWVEDQIPIGAAYVSGGELQAESNTVLWNAGSLAPNERREFQFVVTAQRTLVNSQYRVFSDSGANIRGQAVVVTVVDDTPPPPSGDGNAITNRGADIRWTVTGQLGTGKSNAVRNPMNAQYLPIIPGP